MYVYPVISGEQVVVIVVVDFSPKMDPFGKYSFVIIAATKYTTHSVLRSDAIGSSECVGCVYFTCSALGQKSEHKTLSIRNENKF